MKKILLVAPKFESLSPCWELHTIPFIRKKAFIVPLHLATLAALTPGDIEVDIWDEFVHGRIQEETCFSKEYDLVGITSNSTTIRRARDIAAVFRKQGIPAAVGGVGISTAPQQYRDDFDILFIGEAELTWPRFIEDFLASRCEKEYRQDSYPAMSLSPPPRWDSIALGMKDTYLLGGVQTTRGCPFNCEFCSSWQFSGRQMRLKPIRQVLDEIATLEGLGMEQILLCVDNFFGKPGYSKTLLKELIPLNNSFAKPLRFRTEISINIARDDEMLALLADANFNGLFIGIESPNKKSLEETKKVQNLYGDLLEDCRKIMSYGLPIEGSMIVGFDHDTPDIFQQQFEFLQEACIPVPKMHLLKANPGTDLWERLLREGRLVEDGKQDKAESISAYVNPRATTNIIPKGMTRLELLSGYLDLVEKIYDWDNFAARLMGFVSLVNGKSAAVSIPGSPDGPPPGFKDFLDSLDEKARSVIFKIFSHARQQAPAMMQIVLILIIRQYMEAADLPAFRGDLLKQIRLEESRRRKSTGNFINYHGTGKHKDHKIAKKIP